ncbi:MAG TPA: Gfo/Idh/MocA family oxidoreductase [Longimicrobium sp.]|nr:Gfo/Idh/MocA family oxidoreductase [Longimicrobium sp.]
MSAPVRVGVIGVGSLGFHHARILREVPGAAMAGVFDASPERTAAVAAELGVNGFRSLEEALGSVDAAVIAVPTTGHAEVALAALDAGVHLLIEKPIASTLEEAEAIVARAEAGGLTVATGHVERFNGALRACEEYLEEPRFIESHRLAPFGPRGTDVAVVLDLMIHDIDLLLGLVRRPVEQLDAVGIGVLTPNVDIANARLVFGGGAVANITASRVSMERMRKIRFFQRSGYVSLDLAAGKGEFLRLKKGATMPEGDVSLLSLMNIVERIELVSDGQEPLRAELEAWVGALRGERPLVVSGRDGRDALEVALRIMQKIEDHHAVALAAAS